MGWLHRGVLIESMMHYSARNADGQAGLLIGRDRLVRIEPQGNAAAIHMTDHAQAAALLPAEAERAVSDLATQLAPLLVADRAPPGFFYGPAAAPGIGDGS